MHPTLGLFSRNFFLWMLLATLLLPPPGLSAAANKPAQTGKRAFLRLPLKDYRDKMMAGWLGQMAGLGWAGSCEYRFSDRILAESEMPSWRFRKFSEISRLPDLSVEMAFLQILEKHGMAVTERQAAIDFANSDFPLAGALETGRNNLRQGIAPPDAGHPQFNRFAADTDYQTVADFTGLIAPGMPATPIAFGEKIGRFFAYGDGLYAGQFIGALYSLAFFENELATLVEKALPAIPPASQYAEMVRDTLAWFKEHPEHWEKTWQLVQRKYRQNPDYQHGSVGGKDSKINGAYILIGLLYGNRNPELTLRITCRCGQDTDSNTATAAGILFTTLGFHSLPTRLVKEIKSDHLPNSGAGDFSELVRISEKLARQGIAKAGGWLGREKNGDEVLVIPVQSTKPSPLELSWFPGPPANSRFTPGEMNRLRTPVGDAKK